MGKWKHRLSNLDTEKRHAQCSACGFVRIGRGGTTWRCGNALNEASRIKKFRQKYGIEISPTIKKSSCEICHGNIRISYDHCHETGKFRGWLCMKCNTALGLVGDDIKILEAMIEYLKK